ncbi:hypothetical protein [Kaistia terrae]|uniref:Replication protein n=1 Tax=Kaistia terrae TaxID=537017 RepID=A0ABW0Q940_9HYPH|nr:hypothetical protein [Kaistia terrae]MCX5581220.1 hypothetical protein [Kaistia terrae]
MKSPFAQQRRGLRQALDEAGVRVAFGGFDISFNEHEKGEFVPHWKPHAWILLGLDPSTAELEAFRGLMNALNKSDVTGRYSFAASRTLRLRKFDGKLAGIAYALKTDFERRVTVPPGWRAGTTTRQNTRHRPLTADQKLELALSLDRIGISCRVFLHGLRMVHTKSGPRLKRCHKQLSLPRPN